MSKTWIKKQYLLLGSNYQNILIFSSVFFIFLFILNYSTLEILLGMGLHGDDWKVLLWSKTLTTNHLINITDNLRGGGYGFLHEMYHIYFLERLWGGNISAFQLTNILIKTLATFSIFPMVLVIFKDKILSLFTTILFAISATATASLEWVILAGDYWALLMINMFLVIYYLSVKSNKLDLKWAFLLPIPFLGSMFFSPIRAYPILLVPMLIETFILATHKSIHQFRLSLFRLTVIYLPVLLIILFMNRQLVSFYPLESMPIIEPLIKGDWIKAALPIIGLGTPSFPTSVTSKLFVNFKYGNYGSYITYILIVPSVVFIALTSLFSAVLSKRPKRFFKRVFIPVFPFIFISYLPFLHPQVINHVLRPNIHPSEIFNIMIGVYILTLSFVAFLEWLEEQKKDPHLFALWIGPTFSLIFIIATVILTDKSTSFSTIHRYLMIPSLGIYLALASILSKVFWKLLFLDNKKYTVIGIVMIFAFYLSYFQMNRELIKDYYGGKLKHGRSFSENNIMLQQARELLSKLGYDFDKPAAFFIDTSTDPKNGEFYEQGFVNGFTYWIYMPDRELHSKCAALIIRKEQLSRAYQTKGGQKGFILPSYCVLDRKDPNFTLYGKNGVMTFYPISSFYAFRLENKDVIDITQQTLDEIQN
ncbi:hypothetical protein A3C32_04280 [Candidatus Daviesbacteria bacterium RIFCSPHIGHO2_02_FULL_41_14]|uniref:Glycosyltransferase RgtA/B/C/D-like domain-containing protein n=1 Tax=Candidatus Daviesbacteria bacterium RIFCSPLOWO2_01_FULL_40_24 TaxID=1797787 RepID=A0A1F5MJ93_9BACT|nr:MAG: hypothetical protein A3C32_04280 [Candidatus Daviesbacteria bacterium RIFCSPHIGHO2_02_FULL_41_14]OGE65444.1 MAG: hypothetical protein A3B49_00975 [Candidatus Daviesbacteria bacterium RIFCSPLOWO2_01_FULL_40_24]